MFLTLRPAKAYYVLTWFLIKKIVYFREELCRTKDNIIIVKKMLKCICYSITTIPRDLIQELKSVPEVSKGDNSNSI